MNVCSARLKMCCVYLRVLILPFVLSFLNSTKTPVVHYTLLTGDIFGTLFRRISNQILQIRNIILTVVGLDGHRPDQANDVDLTRDAFGLHKMIVAVTEHGKVCGFYI